MRSIGSFYLQWSGRFFQDVTRKGIYNSQKRLTHFTIKAGCQNKIIIIKWKGGSYPRSVSRALQRRTAEKPAETFNEEQLNTRRGRNVFGEVDDGWFASDAIENHRIRTMTFMNCGRFCGSLQRKW